MKTQVFFPEGANSPLALKFKSIGLSLFSYFLAFLFLLSAGTVSVFPQVPKGFNYQALLTDATGNAVRNTEIQVKISIMTDTVVPVIVWEELHPSVKTGGNGVFSFTIGTGQREATSSAATFGEVSWSVPELFIRTQVYYENSWKILGAARIWSVPYSLVADELGKPFSKLSVNGSSTTADEALFEVKNVNGQTIFAVYNEGVRVYVDNSGKGAKGGFSIGGFADSKSGEQEFFVVNRDSIRAYIYDDPLIKGSKGGFSIGGFGDSKGSTYEYLVISPDSARIYVDNAPSAKGKKGGFAIGGFGSSKRTDPQNLFTVSDDSVRIYIDDEAKGAKGGFSIGGFADSKAPKRSFFNISTDASGIINPAQNRILWYPVKNAFLTGQVLIEHPDSIGVNSTTSGYESRAKGAYSQAMGYRSVARGTFSTAIGKEAYAGSDNSFALGAGSKVLKSDSYAFGAGAIASGTGSFSFGSSGRDTVNAVSTGIFTAATGDYSFALGQGSRSTGAGSVSLGVNNNADGDFSSAVGFENTSTGRLSATFGTYNTATGAYATAFGNKSIASGKWSSAIGHNVEASGPDAIAIGSDSYSVNISTGEIYNAPTVASGYGSVALGHGVSAQSYASLVVGQQNVESSGYNQFSWVGTDPLFVVGNGRGSTSGVPNRSNAMVILKNGNMGLGINTPDYKLDVIGDSRFVAGSLGVYSGGAGIPVAFRIGRTASEADLSIAAVPGQACNFTNPGDAVLRTSLPSGRLFISNGSGDPTLIASYKKVGINVTVPEEALHIAGNLKVTGNIIYTGTLNPPDYVFLQSYGKYFTTTEAEKFISENGHLPWLTSAKEQSDGIDLTSMQFQTVEAVENLQLQIIELKKQNDILRERQQTEINSLKEEIELLKSMIGMIHPAP